MNKRIFTLKRNPSALHCQWLSFLIFIIFWFISFQVEARRIHTVRGYPTYFNAEWQRGYWYHGGYGPRTGWWWIVHDNWYFYPYPLYPYPPSDAVPVYIMTVKDSPPPPPAPMPTLGAGSSSSPANGTPPANQSATSSIAAPQGKAFSYFCEKTKSYYPTVASCEEGWIATPVKAPGN